ncbi:MAG: T9SS type A sorting domain-containing protein [Bacteroidia bacterium]|nr:T9SS type A sorting domain-containing protein [Bacteroidia bacterium]
MKKILVSFLSIISILSTKAQAPDMGFEAWANVQFSTTIKDPVGWASFNVLAISGMPQSVFRDTIAPSPYAGTASAKVVTGKLPASVLIENPFNTTENLDTVGLLVIGKTQFSTTAPVLFGYPYTTRSATLSFASMYQPAGADSGFVVAYLTKWNVNHRDTIARGTYAVGANQTSYSANSISMVYNPAFNGVNPDTQRVYISSSVYLHPGAKMGSAMYVDALQWSGLVISTNDMEGISNNVTIYPNPASTNINFKSERDAEKIELIDITGRKVGEYQLNENKVNIQTHNYSSGLYIYNLYNKEKVLIGRGKFEIAK